MDKNEGSVPKMKDNCISSDVDVQDSGNENKSAGKAEIDVSDAILAEILKKPEEYRDFYCKVCGEFLINAYILRKHMKKRHPAKKEKVGITEKKSKKVEMCAEPVSKETRSTAAGNEAKSTSIPSSDDTNPGSDKAMKAEGGSRDGAINDSKNEKKFKEKAEGSTLSPEGSQGNSESIVSNVDVKPGLTTDMGVSISFSDKATNDLKIDKHSKGKAEASGTGCTDSAISTKKDESKYLYCGVCGELQINAYRLKKHMKKRHPPKKEVEEQKPEKAQAVWKKIPAALGLFFSHRRSPQPKVQGKCIESTEANQCDDPDSKDVCSSTEETGNCKKVTGDTRKLRQLPFIKEEPVKCSMPFCKRNVRVLFSWIQMGPNGQYQHKMYACAHDEGKVRAHFLRLTACLGRLGKRPKFSCRKVAETPDASDGRATEIPKTGEEEEGTIKDVPI